MQRRGTDISKFRRTYSTRNEGSFPQNLVIRLKKETDQKYGENPNQQCAVYTYDKIGGRFTDRVAAVTKLRSVRDDDQGKGGLSLNNQMDITRAMDTLKFFDVPAVAIMKHTIISGFAKKTHRNKTLTGLFRAARDTDLQSNFGGTLVSNIPLDISTARAMYELRGESPFFVDVVAAPDFEEGVVKYLQKQSKNIRIASFRDLESLPKFTGDNTLGLYSLKDMPTGRVGVQDLYLTSIKSGSDLVLDPMVNDKDGGKHVIARDPSAREMDDLLTAWWLNIAGARSNGIVAVKNGVSVAIGSGQVERYGAVAQCIVKGVQKAMDRAKIKYDPLLGISDVEKLGYNPFEGACVSSDAFFPFRDSIDLLGRAGVSAVIQPYGSLRDHEVIDAANEHGIAMPATLERCFGHF